MIKNSGKYVHVHTLLSEELYEYLRKLAFVWRKSKSKTLRIIIEEYIKNSKENL